MAQLSSELFQLLNGEKLAGKRHEAMMLQTVTEDGWPHTAMISAGEILALNKTDIRLALWQGTTDDREYCENRTGALRRLLERQSTLCAAVFKETARIQETPNTRERRSPVRSKRPGKISQNTLISSPAFRLS